MAERLAERLADRMAAGAAHLRASGPGRRRRLLIGIGLGGVLLSVAAWLGLGYWQQRGVKSWFQNAAGQRASAIEVDCRATLASIENLTSFLSASPDLDARQFHAVAAFLLERHSSVESLWWIPRAEGDSALAVRFVEPESLADSKAAGLAAQPDLAEAIAAARKASSVRVEWLPEALFDSTLRKKPEGESRENSLVAIAPAAPIAQDGQSAAAASREPVGFLIGDLSTNEIIRRSDAFPGGIDGRPLLRVVLAPAENGEAPTPEADASAATALRYESTFNVGGRAWKVVATPTRDFLELASPWFSRLVLVVGLVLTGLALGLVALLSRGAAHAERIVGEQQTALDAARDEIKQQEQQRKKVEEALQEIEVRYLSLVESLPLNVLQKNMKGELVFANQRYCQLLGRTFDELKGKTDFDLFPAALAQKYRDDDMRAIASGAPIEDIEQHSGPDGERKYVHVFKAPLRSADGSIAGIQGIFWDVTDRFRAEEKQKQADARFRKLVESNVLGVMICSLDGRILEANDALLQIVGYTRDELDRGEVRWDRLTPPEHRANDARAIEQLMRTGSCPPWEKEYLRKDGGRAPILLGVTMLEGSKDECISFVLDISERKQAEVLMRAAQQAALAASEAKSRFLANMSHEIRTPLNGIIGLTELVLKTPLAAEQEEYLTLVRQSGESLLSIINDVLDYSKVEAGKLELYRNPFDLRETVGDAMKSLAIRAHEKGLELACDVAPGAPDSLLGDAGRLRQILLNLVGNAIKFTEAGEVVLSVAPADSREREGLPEPEEGQIDLHFTVSDTGLGIPPEKLDLIFHAFEQVDGATTRKFGGTGLGLAISSALVRLMQGRIWVESEIGRGSQFHFLARFQVAEQPPARADSDTIAGAKVLIVDDNSTNRRILQEMTRNWRMTAVAVSGAEEAIAAMQAARAGAAPFRLVLTDSHMPSVDGFSLAERIRQDDRLGGAVIMMLTSGARPGDVARCEQLGIAAYLMKPVKQSELFDAIALALSSDPSALRERRPVRASRGAAPKIDPLKILLVEDSLVNQKLALGLLKREGHEVSVAANGHEAVAAAAAERFDTILMDVQMPEMDGLEATRAIRLRERKENRYTPIMAMTAHAMQGDRERCLAAGMDDYISKPIQAELLWTKLAALAGRAAGAASDSSPPSATSDQPAIVEAPATVSVNWGEAMAAVNNDRELLCEVIDAFLTEAPKLLASLRQSIEEKNAELLHRSAHTLKGNMRFFGVVSAVEPALALEQMGKKAQFVEASEVFPTLEKEMSRLLPALREFLGRGEC